MYKETPIFLYSVGKGDYAAFSYPGRLLEAVVYKYLGLFRRLGERFSFYSPQTFLNYSHPASRTILVSHVKHENC